MLVMHSDTVCLLCGINQYLGILWLFVVLKVHCLSINGDARVMLNFRDTFFSLVLYNVKHIKRFLQLEETSKTRILWVLLPPQCLFFICLNLTGRNIYLGNRKERAFTMYVLILEYSKIIFLCFSWEYGLFFL